MKQVKISMFFGGVGSQKKRPFEESEPSSSQKSEAQAKKRRIGKAKTNKENGCRKLSTIFASKPIKPVVSPNKPTENVRTSPDKPVLSPRKLTENVRTSPDKPVLSPRKLTDNVRISPEKSKARRDLENEFSDFGFDEFEKLHEEKSDLVLNRPVRCEVMDFTFSSQPKWEQAVRLRAIGSEKTGICKLRDMWTFVNVVIGETVCVKAEESDGEWVVNGKHGFIILQPDVMLSVTTLVRGMYCMRKGILSNLHKNVKSDGRSMIIGRVVHDLLQESLRKKLETEEEVKTALNGFLSSQKYLREFFLNRMKLDDVTLEATAFVPKIVDFVRAHVKGDVAVSGNNFRGRITEIADIEELVTSSNYGVQGRVDVTVKVESSNGKRTMPLELKTGRASFSKEHKIQVIMYTLLLDEVVRNVDSGLLLYLKDGILQEVKPELREIRDFIMLRNEFVKYAKDEEDEILPDPIRSASCGKCSYARLCKSYLRRNGSDSLPPNHPIRELNFPDIADSHVDYFLKWTKMLFVECSTESVLLEDVSLECDPVRIGDDYRHVFRAKKAHGGGIQPGGSVEIGKPFQRGRVVDSSDGLLVVLLPKRLKSGENYRIESSKSSIHHLYLTNLAFFLEEEHRRLRELIVDGAPPKFEPGIPKNLLSDDYVRIIKPLNREQQRAIFKVVTCNDYLLIRGPPGTGKTETIVSLIKFLNHQNKTVLVTGHTHSSIDNILLKLTGVDYLRFGSLSSIDERLHENCFSRLIETCSTMEEVERLYGRKVMASTCLGLDLEMIDRVRFDYCLIDESSQVMQAEAIRPLMFCRKFVLIGDSNQLPPVVRNPEAKKLGMDVSIFERLEEKEESIVTLSQQYRMNETLNNLANDLTYGGILKCGNSAISGATLSEIGGAKSRWIRDVLSSEMEKSMIFVDTSGCYDHLSSPGKQSRSNLLEAGIIGRLVTELRGGGIREEDIGVVSPFCGQVQLVKSILQSMGIGKVQVSTVDQYQGRDKNVILFSCVKRTVSDVVDGHLLNDHRRLTVAVTRAKVKLIVIGDAKSVSVYSPIKKLLSLLTPNQILRLKNGENDFSIDDLRLDDYRSLIPN